MLPIPSTNRGIESAALFDIANEHAKAIYFLCENKMFGSAHALVRSLFETYIRGMWILKCATETEIKKFKEKDIIGQKFEELVKLIEEKTEMGNLLLTLKKDSWSALCSYTHGGRLHTSRRFDGKTIEPHYDINQVDEIIRFSSIISILIFAAFIDLSEKHELDELIETIVIESQRWIFFKS
jgi:hypothetical protein